MSSSSSVLSAQFSGDGISVVTASADNTARLWDVKTGNPLGEFMRHGDTVMSAQFNADGRV
ncbi:WD40 repeat domain-containing protein [Nitrosospira sp. Is2]|uniref:WD40 repeat domain-containing protein n=1 Tax=Nitrosospira sp. Is2 TaxID=3080532 RepID=UPI003985E68A